MNENEYLLPENVIDVLPVALAPVNTTFSLAGSFARSGAAATTARTAGTADRERARRIRLMLVSRLGGNRKSTRCGGCRGVRQRRSSRRRSTTGPKPPAQTSPELWWSRTAIGRGCALNRSFGQQLRASAKVRQGASSL